MGPAGELFGDARLLEAIGRGRSVPLQKSVAAVVGEVELCACCECSRRHLHRGGRGLGRIGAGRARRRSPPELA